MHIEARQLINPSPTMHFFPLWMLDRKTSILQEDPIIHKKDWSIYAITFFFVDKHEDSFLFRTLFIFTLYNRIFPARLPKNRAMFCSQKIQKLLCSIGKNRAIKFYAICYDN